MTADDVELKLVGQTVDVLWVAFGVTLALSNSAMVVFESAFTITGPDGEPEVVDPEGDKATLVPALRLHTQEVTSAEIDGSSLAIAFSGGASLRADPTPEYESWHYSGPEKPPVRVMALGGGDLAIWTSEATPDTAGRND